GGIVLDGNHDMVTIPASAGLDVHRALTLGLWVRPSTPEQGWGALIQKQVDAWFLQANSDRGGMRPSAGGPFGGVIEILRTPESIPSNAWTHLAFTYDGRVLRLYLNGREAAARQRWVSGEILSADVAGIPLTGGALARSAEIRAALSNGASVRARAVLG